MGEVMGVGGGRCGFFVDQLFALIAQGFGCVLEFALAGLVGVGQFGEFVLADGVGGAAADGAGLAGFELGAKAGSGLR